MFRFGAASLLAFAAWAQQAAAPAAPRELFLAVGKSIVIDSPVDIARVSVADGEVAEAVGISPREVLVNGKGAGETSLIVWQQGGNRLLFDLLVRKKDTRLESIQRELSRELEGQTVSVSTEGTSVFLRGTVNDLAASERAEAIAGALGKPVNLLNVKVPPGEPQILLRVRFANVDRAVGSDLGVNLFSTGALNTIGGISTQQFNPPRPGDVQGGAGRAGASFSISDALNIFLFRPDLDLGATIKALESKRFIEILAEPNLLTSNGRPASFLAGGEFPYPVVQGGGVGFTAITIQFREFGSRINFTPTITARGTIRLQVAPEVSSLDYANGLVFQGFTIPGLASRKVSTEIELDNRQSFAIAGLLDNRLTEQLSKIPGLGDIPGIGKLFQSRSLNKNKQELLVVVTPEFVRPMPVGQEPPKVDYPKPFLKEGPTVAPRTPAVEATGPVPVVPPKDTVPVERLKQERASMVLPSSTPTPAYQLIPVPVQTTTQPPAMPAPVPPVVSPPKE
jgi:pilus assembly protein CpaC